MRAAGEAKWGRAPHPKLREERQLQGSYPGVPTLVGELISPSQEELGPHLGLKLTGA